MKKILLSIMLLLLLTQVGSAQSILSGCSGKESAVQVLAPWYCSQINQAVAADWSKWEPVAIAAVMFSFMIATLVFMFGVALRNDRIRNFGTAELYEAVASTLIAGLFLVIAAIMFGVIPALATGPYNPYTTSLTYIAQTINITTANAKALFSVGLVDGYYANTYLTICTPAKGAVEEGGAAAELLGGCHNVGRLFNGILLFGFFWPAWSDINLLTDAIVSFEVQYYLIVFFMYAAIPVFLIPGIIFRSFLPTRTLGGMMMAIAIGFYFIMPILFSIAYYFTNTNLTSQLSDTLASLQNYGQGTGAEQNALSAQSPLVLAVSNIKSNFSTFWLSMLFFPTLIIAMTYAFIVQIAELIGGMAKTSGRLRAYV